MKNGNIAQAEQPKPASHRDSNIELFRIITMFSSSPIIMS